jgi:acyl-CoA reductase-like NAD-dependent aldehyde dehydrogenase
MVIGAVLGFIATEVAATATVIAFTAAVEAAVGSAIIAANAARPGRMLALELGGRNAGIVLDALKITQAQRCTTDVIHQSD